MKFNKECYAYLMKFIEEKLTFRSATSCIVTGVYLSDFAKSYPNYSADEIHCAFYFLKTMEYITTDASKSVNDYFIDGFTAKGCEMILRELHRN